jgi:hypothetical protein
MPATINGTSGFGGNLTGNVTGNADTSTASTTATKLSTTAGDAPTYACRAWVNFNGEAGATVDGEFRCTIRAQGNVSKVVRIATGNYQIYFAAAMQDSNYCIISSGNDGLGDTTFRGTNNLGQNSTASSCQILHKGVNAANQAIENGAHIQVAIFR